MSYFSKFTKYLTIVTIILLGYSCSNQTSYQSTLKQAANEMNKSCPMILDKETRLDNVLALPDKVFQYNYTLVNMEKADINLEELKAYLQPNIFSNIKTNPGLKDFRENKVTMAYYYRDKSGVFLFEISATADEYLKK